jgi:hypothetical protein
MGLLNRKEGFFQRFAVADRTLTGPFQPTPFREYKTAPFASGRDDKESMISLVHRLSNVFEVLVDIPFRHPQLTCEFLSSKGSFLEEADNPATKRLISFLRNSGLLRPPSLDHRRASPSLKYSETPKETDDRRPLHPVSPGASPYYTIGTKD